MLGLVAYLMLFVAVFYYALKWLGLITSPARRNAFLGLVVAAVLSALASSSGRAQFFGVGLPFGMLIGLDHLPDTVRAGGAPRLRKLSRPKRRSQHPTAGGNSLIGLFSAIVAHYTEIHFGIAIV